MVHVEIRMFTWVLTCAWYHKMNVWCKPLFWSTNITRNFPSMSEMFILAQMKKNVWTHLKSFCNSKRGLSHCKLQVCHILSPNTTIQWARRCWPIICSPTSHHRSFSYGVMWNIFYTPTKCMTWPKRDHICKDRWHMLHCKPTLLETEYCVALSMTFKSRPSNVQYWILSLQSL
jgi:hypothetical protein